MRRKAYAKLTFFLHAQERKEGMLRFKNIIMPIDLFDMVYLEKSPEMVLETDKEYLPNDKRNTVYKSIMIMKKRYDIKDNFKVRIVKNIPAQSGLGGGSADAAAVINMLNDLYDLNLTSQELIDVAREIDEDTPFCLFNKPAIVEGIGDEIEILDYNMDLYYVMVKPGFGVSTKSFLKKYQHFHYDHNFDLCHEGLISQNFELMSDHMHNDFQRAISKKNSKLKKVARMLKDEGLQGVCMSGTGTTIFGLTEDRDEAIRIYEKIVFDYPFVKYGRIKK